MKTLNRENIVSYFFAVVSAAFSRVALLLITIINGRVMSQEEFGLFSILLLLSYVVTGIISGGGDLWLNPFTQHDDAQQHKTPRVSRVYVYIVLGLAAIGIGIAALLPYILPYSAHIVYTSQIACVYGIVAGINEGLFAILRSSDRVKTFFTFKNFICPLLLLIGSVSTTHLEAFRFFWLSIGIFGALTGAIVLFLIRHHKQWLGIFYKPPGLVRHTAALIGNTVLVRLLANVDVFVLSFFMPLSFVGYYFICVQLSLGFQIMQHCTFLTLPWQLSAQNEHQSQGKSLQMIRVRQRLLLFTALIVLLGTLLLREQIVDVTGGGVSLVIPFVVLMLIRFTEIAWGPLQAVLISNHKAKGDVMAALVSAFVWGIVFCIGKYVHGHVLRAALEANMLSLFGLCVLRYSLLKRDGLAMMTYMGLKIPLILSLTTGIVGYFMIRNV